MDQKAQIFLDRTLKRVDNGEFDEHLSIPFASRKLMKAVVTDKMKQKVENNSTPVFSDTELYEIVGEVRDTAAETTALFIKMGLLTDDGKGYGLDQTWQEKLYPKRSKSEDSE